MENTNALITFKVPLSIYHKIYTLTSDHFTLKEKCRGKGLTQIFSCYNGLFSSRNRSSEQPLIPSLVLIHCPCSLTKRNVTSFDHLFLPITPSQNTLLSFNFPYMSNELSIFMRCGEIFNPNTLPSWLPKRGRKSGCNKERSFLCCPADPPCSYF